MHQQLCLYLFQKYFIGDEMNIINNMIENVRSCVEDYENGQINNIELRQRIDDAVRLADFLLDNLVSVDTRTYERGIKNEM